MSFKVDPFRQPRMAYLLVGGGLGVGDSCVAGVGSCAAAAEPIAAIVMTIERNRRARPERHLMTWQFYPSQSRAPNPGVIDASPYQTRSRDADRECFHRRDTGVSGMLRFREIVRRFQLHHHALSRSLHAFHNTRSDRAVVRRPCRVRPRPPASDPRPVPPGGGIRAVDQQSALEISKGAPLR